MIENLEFTLSHPYSILHVLESQFDLQFGHKDCTWFLQNQCKCCIHCRMIRARVMLDTKKIYSESVPTKAISDWDSFWWLGSTYQSESQPLVVLFRVSFLCPKHFQNGKSNVSNKKNLPRKCPDKSNQWLRFTLIIGYYTLKRISTTSCSFWGTFGVSFLCL